MRHKINHAWPDDVQPQPEDNTTVHVMAQVAAWRRLGVLIHPQSAMEIASWWQGPNGYGEDFAAFQSTGTIAGALLAAIDNHAPHYVAELWDAHPVEGMRWVQVGEFDPDDDPAAYLNALHALRAYVLECKVTPWLVGHNMVGYSPESDVYQTLDYESALSCFVDQIGILDGQFDDATADHYDVDGSQTCGECEACSTAAFAAAARERWDFKSRYERPLVPVVASETFQISGHRNDHYWLSTGEEMTYAQYLKTSGDIY